MKLTFRLIRKKTNETNETANNFENNLINLNEANGKVLNDYYLKYDR